MSQGKGKIVRKPIEKVTNPSKEIFEEVTEEAQPSKNRKIIIEGQKMAKAKKVKVA